MEFDVSMRITQTAPKNLMDSSGKPMVGQFDGIPQDLGVELFRYKNEMDNSASRWRQYFDYKQFQFVSVISDNYIIGVALADIRYLGSAFCYVYDIQNNALIEETWLRPFSIDTATSPSPYSSVAHIGGKDVQFNIVDGQWQVVLNTRNVKADLRLLPFPNQSLPLSMCTPTGYNGWTYTQKHNALRIEGNLSVLDNNVDLTRSLASYDFSAGYMRRETSWRWASINHKAKGTTLGLNLAAGVNETGSCENVFWVNGERHLLGPVHFDFVRSNDKEAQEPTRWRIYSDDGQVDLEFQSINCRSEKLNLWLLKSNFRQFIGHFSGYIQDDQGTIHRLNNAIGLTEDHFARW